MEKTRIRLTHLEQKRFGFRSSLFGPVQLPFSLPAGNTPSCSSATGAKCTLLTTRSAHARVTSVQRRRTSGSPKYSPPAPKCCTCGAEREGVRRAEQTARGVSPRAKKKKKKPPRSAASFPSMPRRANSETVRGSKCRGRTYLGDHPFHLTRYSMRP